MSLNLGSNKFKELYLGSNKIKEVYLGSNKVYGTSSEFETFYFLTYCQQAKNVSTSTNTNIRYYEKGEAKESAYNDNPTRLAVYDLSDTNFGSFKGVYVTSVYSPSNWTTYQMQILFTQDMANALIGDNGLQLEFIFKLNSTGKKGATSNYARYVPINMGYLPRVMSYGNGYNYLRTKCALDESPINTITSFTGNSNGFTFQTRSKYIFLPDDSTLGTTPHHLVITISKKNQFIRVWLDGVLSINTAINITDSDSTILGKVNGVLQGWQMANVNNLVMTQIGIREAIWKDAINYTPPSQAYLAVADYF